MRILGIDPGYAIVGFGVVSYHGADFTPLEYGAITTEAGTRFAARLTAIYDDLDFLLKRFQPDCIAIERLYFTSNQKTVIDVAQARGVIVLCAEQHQIPMYEDDAADALALAICHGHCATGVQLQKRIIKAGDTI